MARIIQLLTNSIPLSLVLLQFFQMSDYVKPFAAVLLPFSGGFIGSMATKAEVKPKEGVKTWYQVMATESKKLSLQIIKTFLCDRSKLLPVQHHNLSFILISMSISKLPILAIIWQLFGRPDHCLYCLY